MKEEGMGGGARGGEIETVDDTERITSESCANANLLTLQTMGYLRPHSYPSTQTYTHTSAPLRITPILEEEIEEAGGKHTHTHTPFSHTHGVGMGRAGWEVAEDTHTHRPHTHMCGMRVGNVGDDEEGGKGGAAAREGLWGRHRVGHIGLVGGVHMNKSCLTYHIYVV